MQQMSLQTGRAAARPWGLTRLATPILLVGLLLGCGGGGQTGFSGVTMRPLSAEFATRKAVNYSPYRTATSNAGLAAEVIPPANIKQDLELLVAAGFGLIRVFDSSDKVAKATLQVIAANAMDIKVQLGVFIQSGDESFNQAEIARAVALAKDPAFKDLILGVSVGNENMVVWSFNKVDPTTMAGYLKKVRDAISQPVTTDDNWAFWAKAPLVITDVVDYASVHTYVEQDTVHDTTVWNWRFKSAPALQRAAAMMDGALVATDKQYTAARSYLNSKGLMAMPITIGETGWQANDPTGGSLAYRVSAANQRMYYERLGAWGDRARNPQAPTNVFYFEAFDEPWKQGDDQWGLFNKDRQARCAIQAAHAETSAFPYEPGAACADSAALHWIAPTLSAAVDAARFRLYSDAPATASELQATGLRWDPFGGSSVFVNQKSSAAAPGDGSQGLELTIVPANYGWGTLLHAADGSSFNLSQFASGGVLHFSVRTTYPGKLEIGLQSDSDDRDTQDAYLQLANGAYGYCNTGAWCQVAIPLSAFAAVNPKFDPSLLLLFIVADRFAITGNTPTTAPPPIEIDAIYLTR